MSSLRPMIKEINNRKMVGKAQNTWSLNKSLLHNIGVTKDILRKLK